MITYCIIARYDRELQLAVRTVFNSLNCIIARYDRELQHCRLNHQLLLYCIIARYDWYIYRIVTDFLDESTSKSAIGPPHIIFIAAYWFSVIFNDLTEPF